MNLESPRVTTSKNQQEMYNFLSDVENYRQIMPSSMEKFEVTGPEKFRFSLKGMPEIELQITEKHEPELIVLGSTSENLNFALNVLIEPEGEDKSITQMLFNGKFNAMMSMMVKGPLTKFINTLSENVAKL